MVCTLSSTLTDPVSSARMAVCSTALSGAIPRKVTLARQWSRATIRLKSMLGAVTPHAASATSPGKAIGTQAEFYRTLWASGAAGSEITLQVWRAKAVREISVRSIDRMEYLRPALQA